MEFRIADTFTASLAKLNGNEQKAVKTTAFDLQLDPANPGMQFHKLAKIRDPNFWSIRVSRDIRIIVHKTAASLLLCYVDHHDKAYRWAERRKLETHPRTGAAQLVELRERVEEIAVPKYHVDAVQCGPSQPPVLAGVSEEELLDYGVPAEWVDDVHRASEDSLLDLAEHLPAEAAEALLRLAAGEQPLAAEVVAADIDPFEHPDALRRFRVLTNVEELERALEYPWEKWTVFLHPAQRGLVERSYSGPARVAGSAGTGKTIVALHRAVYLARQHSEARILVTTFSPTLAGSLRTKLKRVIGNEPAVHQRITVLPINDVGQRLYEETYGEANLVEVADLRTLLSAASTAGESHRFSDQFLWTEWNEVADAWQLEDWESYRDVARLGRKARLGEKQRKLLWEIFERVREKLQSRNLLTTAALFSRATEHLSDGGERPYDFAIVDEAQDLGVPQLRFLAALGASRPDGLFFTGDLGQRIFQPPFSWKSLGVDVRGRSYTLRINYRTSHQIRQQADRLLPPELADVDGISEDRRGTVSIFNGPEPEIETYATEEEESAAVGEWIAARAAEELLPHEIGLFVRSEGQLARARQAVEAAGLAAQELKEDVETEAGKVAIGTMHLAKGLEFRAVAVMACDDEVLPLQERIEAVGDDADLEDVFNTERHLFYVACTRARDQLLVTGVEPASEFLEDLLMG